MLNTSLPDVDSFRFARCLSGPRTVQLWDLFGAYWGLLGGFLGASWGHQGASSGPLGGVLGLLGALSRGAAPAEAVLVASG
eukprot:1400683-Pyramimonas_sp.AAC.1